MDTLSQRINIEDRTCDLSSAYSLDDVAVDTVLSSEEIKRSSDLSAILELCAASASHNRLPIAGFFGRLQIPLMLGQVEVFRNHFGQTLGYIVWALLHPEVEERLLTNVNAEILDFEWNEGKCLWVVDCIFSAGSIIPMLRHLRDYTFKDFDQITYMRLKGRKVFVRRISRGCHSRFWIRQ